MAEDLTICVTGDVKMEHVHKLEDCDRKSPDCTVSSMSLAKKDKTCLVCGDRALGYNFNAISCESCKAFFRRNAHKTIRGRCEGKCDITIESRSFCKRCRLNKCFTVGMRKDMILSDDQKNIRKQKIVINKLKKTGHIEDPECVSSPVDVASKLQETIESHTLDELRCTFPNLTDRDLNVLVKIKQERDKQSRIKQDMGQLPSWMDSQENIQAIISKLPEVDQMILEELDKASEQSAFLGHTQTQLKTTPHNPTEFLNVAEGFVRRIIKIAKNVEFFKMVSKEDQIALLKGAIVEVMMLRSAINYDINTESWSLSTVSCLTKGSNSDSENSSPAASPFGSGAINAEAISAFLRRSGAGDGLSSVPSSLPDMDGNLLERAGGLSSVGAGLASGMTSMAGGISGKLATMLKGGLLKDPVTGEMKISAGLLKMGNSESQTLFLTYSKFIKSLMRTIHGDLVILKLLIMLSLFSSDRQGLTECCKIEEIQECYARILQKYVNLRYPDEKTLFAQIIMKLADLRNINDVHTKMLLKMKIDDIEPLLIEIFDLPS